MKTYTMLHKILNKSKRIPLYYWHHFINQVTVDSPPIFIVGCGHSGTSILLSILGAHPRIHPIPYEGRIVYPNLFNKMVNKFNRWTIASGKYRWVEKSPTHIYFINSIIDWYPSAKILLIIRDGRDVAYSIKARTGSIEQGINRWVKDNLAGKDFWEHPNVHVLRYEDLVTDFDTTIENTLSFLDEEYSDDIKYYYQTPKFYYSRNIEKPDSAYGENHEQYRNWQINQPLFDGRGKWQNLAQNELELINEKGGELLRELRYI